jgi:hypothetical protein
MIRITDGGITDGGITDGGITDGEILVFYFQIGDKRVLL